MLFEVSCGIEETNLSGLTGNEQAGGDLTEEVTFDLDLDTGILAVVVSLVDLWTVSTVQYVSGCREGQAWRGD